MALRHTCWKVLISRNALASGSEFFENRTLARSG
jgi:hypothetical protein